MTTTQPLEMETQEETTTERSVETIQQELKELNERIAYREGLWQKATRRDLVKALQDAGMGHFNEKNSKEVLIRVLRKHDFEEQTESLERELREAQDRDQAREPESEETPVTRPATVIDKELNELYKRIGDRKEELKKTPKKAIIEALHEAGATTFTEQDDKKTLLGMLTQVEFGKQKDALMRELREAQARERDGEAFRQVLPEPSWETPDMAADAAERVEEPQPQQEEGVPALGMAEQIIAEAVAYADAKVKETPPPVVAVPQPEAEKKGKGKKGSHLSIVPKEKKEESLEASPKAQAKTPTVKAPKITLQRIGGAFAGEVVCQGPAKHDLFGEIPEGFRIRKDGDNYYRDRFIGGVEWEKYVNGAGKEGVTQDARTVGKKVREWAGRGGLTRYEKQQAEKREREERRAAHVVADEDRATAR